MADNDSLDGVLADLLSAPTITVADENRTLGRVVERAHRRIRLRRLTAAGVGLTLFVTVGITVIALAHRHTAEVRVQTPAPGPVSASVSDVVVFDDTGGVLTVDLATHVATHHPIAGWRPGDEPFESLRVGNYFVVGWGNVYADSFAGRSSLILGTGVFVPATELGAVWLTSYGKVQTPTERLVEMNGRVLLQVRAPREPGSTNSVPALAGVPGGLVLDANNGLDILDARTGRITRHLGTTGATAAPAFGSMLAWCEQCGRTLSLTDLRTGATRSIALNLHGGFLVLNQFVFSPDGTQLAIPVQPDGAAPSGVTTKVITMKVATGQVTNTIDTHARYASIAWSPDSQRIYIAATNTGSGGEMLVHDNKTASTLDLGPAPGGGRLDTVLTHHDAALLPTPILGTVNQCQPTSSWTYNTKPCSYRYGNQTATTGPNVTTTTSSATTTRPSSQARYAPCSAIQMSALAPEWASPLEQQTDDLLRFKNKGATCELSGYPSVVAAGAGQPDVRAKPGFVGLSPPGRGSILVVPNGSTAQVLVGAIHSCLPPRRYTTLTVAMPGGGSITLTLPKSSVSPNPDFRERDLTLLLAPSCPLYISHFTH